MLKIWYHDKLVGSIHINEDDRWEFEYEPDWNLFPIMPQLPIGKPIKKDVIHNRLIEWFMDNLLPEGNILDAYAASAGIHKDNTYGLLAEYGGDVAGALSITPATAEKPSNEQHYQLLTHEVLLKKIKDSQKGIPLMVADGRKRMSLAGAQDKLTVKYQDGQLYLPEGYTPSTHILKPNSVNSEYPYCPANEYFCMQLADIVGLNVPATHLLSIDDERIYLVERYDRVVKDGQVKRLHQIDGCQLLGLPKSKKYEDQGGVDFQTLMNDAASTCEEQIKTKLDLLNWVIFNYLIGNSDAHAKNFSFLVTKEKVEPAKLYDLVCVEVYHKDNRLSSSIAGEMKAGLIEGAHWDAFSIMNNIKPALTRSRVKVLSEKVKAAAYHLIDSEVFTHDEKLFLVNVISVIDTRINFIDEALKEPMRTRLIDFEDVNDGSTRIDEHVLSMMGVSTGLRLS
ncbi:MAG: HipA domain-containing protein [Methyloprofundus sp.]|nr:HipA domain-containing protein [Methyloprofundus sp.]